MEKQLDILTHTRKNFAALVDSLSLEAINKIPAGFSNNIAWHFCHIVASQQVICYTRAGVQPRLAQEHVDRYRNGTRPEVLIEQGEIDFFKQQSLSLLDELVKDRETGLLNNYQPFKAMYGVELRTIDDAVHYFATHDSLHYGYAQALKKLVQQ